MWLLVIAVAWCLLLSFLFDRSKKILLFPLFGLIVLAIFLFFEKHNFFLETAKGLFAILVAQAIFIFLRFRASLRFEQLAGKSYEKKIYFLIVTIGFVLPYLFIYRTFFDFVIPWGDAPFFYSTNLKELFNLPYLWNFRNDNFGNTQYQILWLYIPTFIYGLLNNFLGMGNDSLIKLVFLFPSTILSFVSSFVLIGKFSNNLWGRFLGGIFYAFNSHFLSVLDGGQIGIGLAYSLFPLSVYFLITLLTRYSLKNFLWSVVFVFLVFSTDIRLGFITTVLGLGLSFFMKRLRGLAQFLGIMAWVAGLSSFWMVPFFINGGNVADRFLVNSPGSPGFVRLVDSMLFYQPHFPLNQFGVIMNPPFYFAIFPAIFLLALYWYARNKDSKVWIFFAAYLVFAFLAKGGQEPFGQAYAFLINKLPFGAAFRDSSKFYIPLLLTGAVGVSLFVEMLRERYKRSIFYVGVLIFYIFLMITINPALGNKLTGLLGNKLNYNAYFSLASYIQDTPGFFRTVWFPERPPMGYSDWEKPGITANTLYLERPFGSMISGSYDKFNFLHSPQLNQWWNLLGIKYLVFPKDERKKLWSEKDIAERGQFEEFLGTIKGISKNNTFVEFPFYEVVEGERMGRVFGQNKAVFVIGGEDIYDVVASKSAIYKSGYVFLEDGESDIRRLKDIERDDAILVFNKKSEKDLLMALFKDKFYGLKSAVSTKWAMRDSNQYVEWKYELEQKGEIGIKGQPSFREFDYGKGIAFSTIAKEGMVFEGIAGKGDQIYLAIRALTGKEGNGLKIKLGTRDFIVGPSTTNRFDWSLIGPISISRKEDLVFENLGGLNAVNTFAVIGVDDFNRGKKQIEELLRKYKRYDLPKDLEGFGKEIDVSVVKIEYNIENPTQYKVRLSGEVNWLVFSERFHKDWILRNRDQEMLPIPFYGFLNGYYVNGRSGEYNLYFQQQEFTARGVYVSLASGFGLVGLVLFRFFGKRKK